MKKILITGPESSGKSALAQLLAAHFGTAWVPEYARAYLTDLKRPYTEADLLRILEGQLKAEAEVGQVEAGEYLFCDTGPEVIYIWSEVRFGRVAPAIARALREQTYTATLLCYPDLGWTYDPLREAPDAALREQLFHRYADLLEVLGRPYAVVRGQGPARLQAALQALAGS